MKHFFLILIIFILSGCYSSSNRINLTPNTKLTNQSTSILVPSSSYETPWIAWFLFSEKYIQLFRHIPDMMSEDIRITVRSIPKDEISTDFLLYKNNGTQMEERRKNFIMSEWEKKNNKERGVSYRKSYVDYIGRLKCGTRVESSSIALGVGTKSYQTNCTYFDNQNGAKNIHLMYTYTYSSKGTKFQDDKTSSNVTAEKMQEQFKKDIKAIFDSLVIHDMDIEKMSKSNLLHDKKYDVNTENEIKNYYSK